MVAREYGFGIGSGEDGARKLLSLVQPPTAIFAISDLLAIGAMRHITAAGLCVPDDVAVAGFNDTSIAELVNPPLTTVSAPGEATGRETMKILQQLVDGREPVTRQAYCCPPGWLCAKAAAVNR